MLDVTKLLDDLAAGNRQASAELLPMVYDELRKLAAVRMASESPDHTLQPTALVHEAYLRLIGSSGGIGWANRQHFFAVAAEAMRRILIDSARQRDAAKRGGGVVRLDLDLHLLPAAQASPEKWIDLDVALTALANEDPVAAELAKLRICIGMSIEEAAEILAVSRATGFRQWTYARAWLTAFLADSSEKDSPT